MSAAVLAQEVGERRARGSIVARRGSPLTVDRDDEAHPRRASLPAFVQARATMTAPTWRRYAADPCSRRWTAAHAVGEASERLGVDVATGRPWARASAWVARSGVGPMPSRPIAPCGRGRRRRARRRRPRPRSRSRPAARATSSIANPDRAARRSGTARRRAVRRSRMVVLHMPSKKSRAATGAAPRGDSELHRRVERERDGRVLRGRVGVSDRTAEGAAVADLEVPDQAGSPSASSGTCGGDLGAALDVGLAWCRRRSRASPVVARCPRSSAMRPMSTRWSNTARRNASIGTRLWPPASILAPPPSSASRFDRLHRRSPGGGSRRVLASCGCADAGWPAAIVMQSSPTNPRRRG